MRTQGFAFGRRFFSAKNRFLPVFERPPVPEPLPSFRGEGMGGWSDSEVLHQTPVLPVVARTKLGRRGEVARLIGGKTVLCEGLVHHPEEGAPVFGPSGEGLPPGLAASEGRSRLDGQLVGGDVVHPRQRSHGAELFAQGLGGLPRRAVDEIGRDPGDSGLGEPGHRDRGIRRVVCAAEEPKPGLVERLHSEADAPNLLGRPPAGEFRVVDQILRVGLEENERRGRSKAPLGSRQRHLPEESGRRERGGATPEIDRVRPERGSPELQLRQQRVPVAIEALRSGTPQRSHGEVAVGTDPRTEGNVNVEPRSSRFRGLGEWVRRKRGRIRALGHAAGLDFNTATKADWGICTFPTCFMRFFPSFWRSSSFRFRVTSPP